MRFYEVTRDETVTVATLGEAKEMVRAEQQVYRASVTVKEVEVALDKENVLRLLNNKGGTHQYLREWKGTARGGLKEVNNG
jgi:hypothetical protein